MNLNRTLITTGVIGSLLLLGPALLPSSLDDTGWSGGLAYGAEEDEPKHKTRKTPAMREKVYNKLSEAQLAAEEGRTQEAKNLLSDVERMKDLNSYEMAQLWNFYGFIFFNQENYGEAIRAYKNVLAQPDLPEAMETQTLYSLSQLQFTTDDYAGAVQTLERWFSVAENPGPEPYLLLGQAYYQLKRYREAITPVETAMAIARDQGRPMKENWYLLLRVFYYELQDYPKVVEILEELLRRFPKREYWIQLSGMYGELGQDRKQLVAYETAYLQGFLTRGREVVTLAQLMLQANVPFRGGEILDKGINEGIVEKNESNYRLLSQAWTMAAEDAKAIPALIEAARFSGDGELDIRLAQSYFNLEQFEEAAQAARSGLGKGGLRRRDQANIVLGMALYNLGVARYDEAKVAFREAQSDQRSAKTATQWIRHIDNEKQRYLELQRALGG